MEKNIWRDGMMGLIVGDALGVPVQFYGRSKIRSRENGPVTGMESGGVFRTPAGTWSDDSSMAIGTMVSIFENGDVILEDIMDNFVKWEVKGEFTPFGHAFDQGGTCTKAIYGYMNSSNVFTCGVTGEYANGNGALMRILPVCLYDWDKNEDKALSDVHYVGGLTHNHLRSKMCCGIYYYCVKNIIMGRGEMLIELLQRGIDSGRKHYAEEINKLSRMLDLEAFKNTPEDEIKSSGYVIDTLEAAIWCLITTSSYEECLLKAVNLGDDADTVAAVAGGLAGLYYGYEAIPKEWLSVIKRREWIENILLCGTMN